MEQAMVQVRGLHCMSCVARLERALGRVEGVRRSKVDLRSETVDLAFEPEVLDERSLTSVSKTRASRWSHGRHAER